MYTQNKIRVREAGEMLTLFRMGLFEAAHGCGEGAVKKPPFPKICHTSYNDETWDGYTLRKEDPNNI